MKENSMHYRGKSDIWYCVVQMTIFELVSSARVVRGKDTVDSTVRVSRNIFDASMLRMKSVYTWVPEVQYQ